MLTSICLLVSYNIIPKVWLW